MSDLFTKKYTNDEPGVVEFVSEQTPYTVTSDWRFYERTIMGEWEALGYYLDGHPFKLIIYMAGYVCADGIRENNTYDEVVIDITDNM